MIKIYKPCLLIFLFPIKSFSNSYWIFGYNSGITDSKYTTSSPSTEYLFKEKSFITGKSSDKLNFLISYGKSSDDQYEAQTMGVSFDYKVNLLSFSKSSLFVNNGLIFDFSQLSNSSEQSFNSNALVYNLSLEVDYYFSQKYLLSASLKYEKNLVNLANDPSRTLSREFNDKYLLNLSFGINFDK